MVVWISMKILTPRGHFWGHISGPLLDPFREAINPESGAPEKSPFRLFFGANRDKSHNEQSELEARSTTLISR